MRKKIRRRRGYPTALLIGIKGDQAVIWRIYSETVKLFLKIPLLNIDENKINYNNYESIINALRPVIKEGITSIIIVSPKGYLIEKFKAHIEKHHNWMFNYEITFTYLEDDANTSNEISKLIKTENFKESLIIMKIVESSELLKIFESNLRNNEVLYTVDDLYKSLKMKVKINRIFITDEFFRLNIRNSQFESAQQLCRNLGVKVHIIKKDTKLGMRLDQFGGLVLFIN
jgi:stalled ribosome rescue protein Dom34